MAITSKLTSAGEFLVTNQFDEYSLQNNSYAVQFNGSNQNLQTTATAVTGTWTIEFWAYHISFGGSEGQGYVFNGTTSSNSNRVQLGVQTTGAPYFYAEVAPSNFSVISSTLLSLNTWYHIAYVSDGSTIKIYINGTLAVSGNITQTPSPGTAFYIGFLRSSGVLQYFNGYISNFRYTRSTVYTAAFTPSIAPLTAITNTQLLTCQNPTIIDNSTNALTITNTGTATTSNVPSTFYSVSFNGSQSLSVLTQTAFGYGTGDFTIEFWLRLTAISLATIVSNLSADASAAPHIYLTAGGVIIYYTNSATQISGATLTTGVWYHVALSRASGSTKLFINGTQSGSTYTDATNYGSSNPIAIADYFKPYPTLNGVSRLNGYVSNLRVVKGTALYTANFTPPTRQLTAVAGTSLLTLQSPTIIDKSNTPLTITNNGTAVVKNPISWNTVKREFSDGTFQTFNDIDEYTLQNSVYATQFNGSNQNLLISGSTALDFAGGDFTIECWIYVPTGAHTSTSGMIINRAGGSNIAWAEYEIYVNNGGIYWAASLNNTGYDIGGENATGYIGAYTNNTWTHIAITRSGNVYKGFVNGAQGYTQTITGSLYAAGTARGLAIGSNYVTTWGVNANISTPYNGYISNLRLIKGTALYTSNFTPSISPLTAITNTQLLTCQNPTFIDNSLNAFTITNNNTATTTYVPSKFYTALFNGSNQYLTAPANAGFSFGTGDFTVECWIRTPAFTNTYGRIIVDTRPLATNGSYWLFGLGNTGIPVFYPLVTGTFIGGSTSVATNSWVHLAATRESGTLRLFVNGVSAATPITGNVDNVSSSGSGFRIGFNAHATVGGFAAETLWNGNISNLRVVKGTALYTANFTPPTTQLTAVSGTTLLTFQSPTIIDNSGNALSLTNNGTVTTQSPASFIQTKNRLFSDGSLQVANSFDEYTIKTPTIPVSYLIVAGGGGGTTSGTTGGTGGGGAGGLLSGTTSLVTGRSYSFVVGGGGAGGQPASNGTDSTGFDLTAKGGGGGNNGNGLSGGSGGGGGEVGYVGGSGTAGQGNAGGNGSGGYYYGGGGGGAGAAGTAGTGGAGSGNGGVGVINTLLTSTQATSASVGQVSGTDVYFAGGGGGSVWTNVGRPSGSGAGGLGGGGRGSASGIGPSAGTTNSGGGGGAYGQYSSGTTTGGSGVVIISLTTANYTGTVTGSPTVVTSGSNTILIFKSSGSYTA